MAGHQTLAAPSPTAHLPKSPLFRHVGEEMPIDDRIDLAHARAKAIAIAYKLDLDDVLHLSPRFWALHSDLVNTLDGAAVTLLSIQLNLAAGTIAPFVKDRPDLVPLFESILAFDVSAQFCLTELGHGLDAFNIETTADLLPSGEFILNTPNSNAAKYMPPTLPRGGVPRIAVVMARLRVENEDRGIRPFIVPLTDGTEMCHGVTALALPTRCGAKPVGHALTSFAHVRLPPSALLGSPARARDARGAFLALIWRVGVGSLCLSALPIPGLKVAAYIAARYSMRRTVTGARGRVPILAFRTQEAPILHALAQAFVLEALYAELTARFAATPRADVQRRNALAALFKATAIAHWRESSVALSDRCGAQGLFEHNQMLPMQMEIRGVAIAEGDVLALSIRLGTELVLGRSSTPPPRDPAHFLAAHEAGLLAEARSALGAASGGGGGARSDAINARVLPRCAALVRAAGARMAYEAAADPAARVHPALVRLYAAGAAAADGAWYVERGLLSRAALRAMEEDALDEAAPLLPALLAQTGAEPYAVAAITSEEAWARFVATLPVFRGEARVDALRPLGVKAHL